MYIQWTNMAGFGPTAWNQGGAPVKVTVDHSQSEENVRAGKPDHTEPVAAGPHETDRKK